MDLLCTEKIMNDFDNDIIYQQRVSNSPRADCDSSSSSYTKSPVKKKCCDSSISNVYGNKYEIYVKSYVERTDSNDSVHQRDNLDGKKTYNNNSSKLEVTQKYIDSQSCNRTYAKNLINVSLDFVNTASLDPTFLKDRCLENALKAEERRPQPTCSYFKTIQKDITPPMRKIVTEWMMELCAEEHCQAEVVLLAISYMDRFLLITYVKKTQLQILASACLLLASKLREPSCRALTADLLVFYTDNSIYKSDLIQWELYVLSRLGWDLSTVTPLDFLELLLIRLPIRIKDYPDISVEKVRQHAKAFISLAAKEHHFSIYTASTIAASSIAAALSGLNWHLWSGYTIPFLLNLLTDLTSVDQEFLHDCMMKMEDLFNEHSRNLGPYLSRSHNNQQKNQTNQSKPQQYNNKDIAPTEISNNNTNNTNNNNNNNNNNNSNNNNSSNNSNSCISSNSPSESLDRSHHLTKTSGSTDILPQACKMQASAKSNIQDIKL